MPLRHTPQACLDWEGPIPLPLTPRSPPAVTSCHDLTRPLPLGLVVAVPHATLPLDYPPPPKKSWKEHARFIVILCVLGGGYAATMYTLIKFGP